MSIGKRLLAFSALLATLGLTALAAPANAASPYDFVKLHQNPSFCWDDPNNQPELTLWQCHGGTNQKWEVIFTPRGDLPGYFTFRNAASRFCVDATGGGGGQGAAMLVSPCTFGESQSFLVAYAFNDGHWHQAWRNAATGMCMDLFGGIANGRRIVNWPCNLTAAQLWRFVDA